MAEPGPIQLVGGPEDGRRFENPGSPRTRYLKVLGSYDEMHETGRIVEHTYEWKGETEDGRWIYRWVQPRGGEMDAE